MRCDICNNPAKEEGYGLTLCAACAAWGAQAERDTLEHIASKKRAAMRAMGFTVELKNED